MASLNFSDPYKLEECLNTTIKQNDVVFLRATHNTVNLLLFFGYLCSPLKIRRPFHYPIIEAFILLEYCRNGVKPQTIKQFKKK